MHFSCRSTDVLVFRILQESDVWTWPDRLLLQRRYMSLNARQSLKLEWSAKYNECSHMCFQSFDSALARSAEWVDHQPVCYWALFTLRNLTSYTLLQIWDGYQFYKFRVASGRWERVLRSKSLRNHRLLSVSRGAGRGITPLVFLTWKKCLVCMSVGALAGKWAASRSAGRHGQHLSTGCFSGAQGLLK